MFPDSEIAKSFACSHTKTATIIKEAFSPHFQKKMVENLSNPFSIMLDESNDKIDMSCIILVRVLDPEMGDVCTRFLDIPVVNIGTAQNLFCALKKSLEKYNVDFTKAIAFMSDTANVMKGCRSRVQKLIKNGIPQLNDVGCICQLADLTIKAGMAKLPVDIDQLFIDIFYHSSKRNQEFANLWCSLFTSSEPKAILKHCPTRWLLKSYFLSCSE